MPMFRLQVMSLKRLLFNDDVSSIYLFGDEGEYELLPFHYPLLGALPEGEIRIAGRKAIALKSGVVKFEDNKCMILIEELDPSKPGGISWRDIESLSSLDEPKPSEGAP